MCGNRVTVWSNVSSWAAGIVLEKAQGDDIEDVCWLRQDDTLHMNLAELDATIWGVVNLAITWGMKTVELRTDPETIHRWIDDTLSGQAHL